MCIIDAREKCPALSVNHYVKSLLLQEVVSIRVGANKSQHITVTFLVKVINNILTCNSLCPLILWVCRVNTGI